MPSSESRADVAFVAVGGAHQFLHGAPVIADLSARDNVKTLAYVNNHADGETLRAMLAALGGGRIEIRIMELPRWARMFNGDSKALRLIVWARSIRAAKAILVLERTSTLLKRLPGHCPALIHIPHGVGGPRRAGGGGVDRRFALFDHVLLAGQADYETTMQLNLLPPEKLSVVGQIKIAGLRKLGRLKRKSLFANDRRTVLYNPHFHPRRGSWEQFGRDIIDLFARQDRYNLIAAPHVRLFQETDPAAITDYVRALDCDHIIFDPGSDKSMDMTYTLAADAYLGDVSSQLFEFLIHPRPCVFIDQLGDGGADDTKLPAMWRLGECVTQLDAIMPAIDQSFKTHAGFAQLQRDTMAHEIGDPEIPADQNAADIIYAMLPTDR